MRLEAAIKKTIEYAGKFGKKINSNEIVERIISKKRFKTKIIEQKLEEMNWKNKKNKNKDNKMDLAKKLAKLIEKDFKDILFLGVSGSVAAGHPKKDDDIDLMIITKSNKLWKSRFELRWWIYKKKIPHRKFDKGERKNEFCFNLWLDEANLKMPINKQNLRNAVDLIMLKPLINKDKIYQRLLNVNRWAKKYVATGYCKRLLIGESVIWLDKKAKNKERRIDKMMNWLYFWPQYWYMRKKIKKEIVGLHQAFFHR